MPTTGVLINRNLTNPFNKTVTSVYLNTTLLPRQSSEIPFNHSYWPTYTNGSLAGNHNSSVYKNHTNLKPNCLNCYPNYITISPPLIAYSYPFDYGLYAFLLILLIAGIVCIKIGLSRRKEVERLAAAQRRRARQQAESGHSPSSSSANDNNNTNSAAKEFDLPPSYDEIVQSYNLNNQQQQPSQNISTDGANAITVHSSTNTISAGSSVTIETEICNSNNASTITLNNTTTT